MTHDYDTPDDLALPGDGSLAERFDQWLSDLGVERHGTYDDFLQRMPHLYTLTEAQQLLQLPFALEAGLAGVPTEPVPPFYPPAIAVNPWPAAGSGTPFPTDRIRIGRVDHKVIRGRIESQLGGNVSSNDCWHSMLLAHLCEHTAIFGSTRSGKSTVTEFLLRELDRVKTPFLVIEPVKVEYKDALSSPPLKHAVQRRNFEGDPSGKAGADFIRFDPMRLQSGVTVARHISYLKPCFMAAFPGSELSGLILENGLIAHYTEDNDAACGLGLYSRGGPRGPEPRKDTNGKDWNPFEALLQENTVVELDSVADLEQEPLIMAFLLTFLFEHRQADRSPPPRATKADGSATAVSRAASQPFRTNAAVKWRAKSHRPRPCRSFPICWPKWELSTKSMEAEIARGKLDAASLAGPDANPLGIVDTHLKVADDRPAVDEAARDYIRDTSGSTEPYVDYFTGPLATSNDGTSEKD